MLLHFNLSELGYVLVVRHYVHIVWLLGGVLPPFLLWLPSVRYCHEISRYAQHSEGYLEIREGKFVDFAFVLHCLISVRSGCFLKLRARCA